MVRGRAWLEDGAVVRGFAIDDQDLSARLAVEIFADGEPVALVRADEGLDHADEDPNSSHGFTARLDPAVLARAHRIVARLANRDEIIGALDLAGEDRPSRAPAGPHGAVAWRGGTRLHGHVGPVREGDGVPSVRAIVAGREVARAAWDGWITLGGGAAARRFVLDLPAEFADGRSRAVEVVMADGIPLTGSPCLVVAFPDPLADWIDGWAEVESEKIRARFADGLLPRTVPFSSIEGWLDRFRPPDGTGSAVDRVAVAVVGTAGLEATMASLDRQVGAVCRGIALPSVGSRVGFDGRALQGALLDEAADCPLVVLAISGTRFATDAVARLAEAAAGFPDAAALYPDLLVETPDGGRWPSAFPAFDPEFFLESGYCGLVYAVRRSDLLQRSLGLTTLFELFPGGTAGPSARPVHLPFPFATVPDLTPAEIVAPLASAARARLAAAGEDGEVTLPTDPRARSVRVRRTADRSSLSAVVAVRDGAAALETTLLSLERALDPDRDEIVLVDNESSDPRCIDILAAAAARGHRSLRVAGWFSPARLLAAGAEAARGHDVLFVEPGITGGESGWLDEMRGRLAGRGVAAVGALVSWTSGVVRDAGYALGPRGGPAARFVDRRAGDPGHAGLLAAAHGCAALSAACLVTPRDLFRSLGGFDAAAFPRHLFAVDYALRCGAADLRIVLTPHARMTMGGSPSAVDGPEGPARDQEARLLFERWGLVPGCDPSYSPWMAMDGVPFSGLAWPPAPFRARTGEGPVARTLPSRL